MQEFSEERISEWEERTEKKLPRILHWEMRRLRMRRSNIYLIRVTEQENKENGEEAILS